MRSSSPSKLAINLSARPLRVGFLALTDAAPFIVAKKLGLFARHGLEVDLHREIGWATIRDKIIYGELDAAPAPAPMLWSVQLGVGCPPCEVLTALVLNLHGNALTLSQGLREAGVRDSATLRGYLQTAQRREPVTFGVVFSYSSHHLLLQQWLRGAGIDPGNGVRIVIVPPAQMFRNLAAGTIDGFCSGEPWNSLAVAEGPGWCPTWSAAQSPGHIEKVLLVTRRFAETRPSEHRALASALLEACAWCDEIQNRPRIAELLSQAGYLNLPTAIIAPTLIGRFDCGHGRMESVPDFHVFHRGEANVPAASKAAALQRELSAAGLLAAPVPSDLPRTLFREDLFHEITSSFPTASQAV